MRPREVQFAYSFWKKTCKIDLVFDNKISTNCLLGSLKSQNLSMVLPFLWNGDTTECLTFLFLYFT